MGANDRTGYFIRHPGAVKMLIELWDKGLSASEIARAIGEKNGEPPTRNMVIGKAHRLRCDSRPSPVIYDGEGPTRKVRRRRSEEERARILGEKPRVYEKNNYESICHGIRRFPNMGSLYKTCQWLEGEAHHRNFCGEPTVPGQSWCAHHAAIVWQPKGERAA